MAETPRAQIAVERTLAPDLISRVTELLGYRANSDEPKVQWLSASGRPVYTALFDQIFPLEDDWAGHSDRHFFDGERHSRGGFSARFYQALGLADGAPVPDRTGRGAVTNGGERGL